MGWHTEMATRAYAGGFQVTRLFLVLVLLSGLLAGCRPSGPGSVAGQIKAATAEGEVRNLAGAQVILRGAQDTHTTVTTDGEGSGDQAEASYNYRFDRVPAGRYTMAVTPPPGSGVQPESDITLNVQAEELYPQSVLLLPEGVAKPRPLTPGELNSDQVGYVNERGERVVHDRGGGVDMTDMLLMYLLLRNPPGFGYGAPPVLIGGPRGGTFGSPPYRVEPPPRTGGNGQTITQRPPSVPGQGATRPGGAPASGPGPTYRPPSGDGSSPGGVSPPSGNGSRPGSGVGAPSYNPPAQGVSRPSAAPSRPSAPAPSRSGGGRSGGGRK